jgi:hypothetical protein
MTHSCLGENTHYRAGGAPALSKDLSAPGRSEPTAANEASADD